MLKARMYVFFFVFCLLQSTYAQFSYSGEVQTRLTFGVVSVNTPRYLGTPPVAQGSQWQLSTVPALGLTGHLELEYLLDPLTLRAVFDPSVTIGGDLRAERTVTNPITGDIATIEADPSYDTGLTELYGEMALGDNVYLSAGLERLALETARLNVPFSIAVAENRVTADPKGFFRGIWGGRVVWYPGDWRIRTGGYYQDNPDTDDLLDGQLGGILSVKRNFGEFDLEGHVVYDDQLNLGLGGSALIGDVVLYGEGWVLFDVPKLSAPNERITDWRGALGVTGYLDDILWVLEGAYVPHSLINDVAPQLSAQFSLPFGDEADSLTVDARAAYLGDDGLGGLLGVRISHPEDDYTTDISLNSQFGQDILGVSLELNVTGYF